MINGLYGNFGTGFFNLATQPTVIQEIQLRKLQPDPPDFQLLEESQLRAVQAEVIRASESITQVRGLVETDLVPASLDLIELTSSALGLDTSESKTTLTGTEEVNTQSTTFSPRLPTFAGSSSSQVTIDGIYDGSAGVDTLTFKMKRDATVGTDKMRVQIFDSGGSKLDDFTIAAGTPADTEIATDIGLTISFGDGDVVDNDTFTVNVTLDEASVDPDNPFDGVGTQHPELEYGTTITAGSFTVNGTSVTVNADDTLSDVLSRITSAVDDVSASYSAATDSVTLTRDSAGDLDITLGSDSSGFLDAVKLSGATQTTGQYSDLDDELEDVTALSGVSDGTFSIDGEEFTIDTSTDSLQDVIDTINAANLGLSVGYNSVDDTFELTQDEAAKGNDIVLDDGTSGFFTAVGIEAKTHEGDTLTATETDELEDTRRDQAEGAVIELRDFVRAFNDVVEGLKSDAVAGNITAQIYLDRITEALDDLYPDSDADLRRSTFGIDVDFGVSAADTLLMTRSSEETFVDRFATANDDALDFLLGEGRTSGGLLTDLQDILADLKDALLEDLGPVGVLLDEVA